MPSYKSMLGCSIPTDRAARKECREKGLFYLGLDPESAAINCINAKIDLNNKNPLKPKMSIDDQKEYIVKLRDEIIEEIRSAEKLAESEFAEEEKQLEKEAKVIAKERMMSDARNIAESRK